MGSVPICIVEESEVESGRAGGGDPLRLPGTLLRLLVDQGGRCAVCADDLVVPPNVPDDLTGVVDRDSLTQTVRGLLCHRCHHGLRLFEADPARLQRAAAYLDRPSRASEMLTSAVAE